MIQRIKKHKFKLLSAWGVASIAFALWWSSAVLGLLGAACVVAAFVFWRRERKRAVDETDETEDAVTAVHVAGADDCDDIEQLVQRMIEQDRYALMLRPQIASNLEAVDFKKAMAALDSNMALVPTGQVVVGPIDEALDDGKLDADILEACQARLLTVQAAYLDRWPVTNRQFFEFVAAGGYDEMAIWDEEVWPAVLDFVDRTGHPSPKFWRHGKFLPGQEDLPVVGVSWYEAAAYARWSGKRLATDAEWIKAGSWPIEPKPGIWLQRKYPWGNSFEHHRANIWGSGPERIVPVGEFTTGESVGGIYQLIGNVWEWTSTNFGLAEDVSLMLPVPMKSIRGGAFDTYFESQATCHFQSGENPLSRKHNIGFRQALGVCDLASKIASQLETDDAEEPVEEMCA